MTNDVKIGERAVTVVVEKQGEAEIFQYTRENGESIRKAFSIEAAGAGRYSVLVEGRSYQVYSHVSTLVGKGEIAVNGRTLRSEVHDPRKLRWAGSAER